MENSPSLKTPQKQEDQNANLNSNQEEKDTYDFYLLVYNISKHKNIGTLIRSASAFNIKKVFIIGENKKIIKKFFGSQGTVKKTEFLFFEDIKNVKEFCKENKIFICGVEIGENSKPINSHPFKGHTLFVMGNEGSGLNKKQHEMCDHLVYIPQYSSKTGSLNVAVAGSLIFHHFALWANYKEAEYTDEKYNVNVQNGVLEEYENAKNENENNVGVKKDIDEGIKINEEFAGLDL